MEKKKNSKVFFVLIMMVLAWAIIHRLHLATLGVAIAWGAGTGVLAYVAMRHEFIKIGSGSCSANAYSMLVIPAVLIFMILCFHINAPFLYALSATIVTLVATVFTAMSLLFWQYGGAMRSQMKKDIENDIGRRQ